MLQIASKVYYLLQFFSQNITVNIQEDWLELFCFVWLDRCYATNYLKRENMWRSKQNFVFLWNYYKLWFWKCVIERVVMLQFFLWVVLIWCTCNINRFALCNEQWLLWLNPQSTCHTVQLCSYRVARNIMGCMWCIQMMLHVLQRYLRENEMADGSYVQSLLKVWSSFSVQTAYTWKLCICLLGWLILRI